MDGCVNKEKPKYKETPEKVQIEPQHLCLCVQNQKPNNFCVLQHEKDHVSLWKHSQKCTCNKNEFKYFIPAYSRITSLPDKSKIKKIELIGADGTRYTYPPTPYSIKTFPDCLDTSHFQVQKAERQYLEERLFRILEGDLKDKSIKDEDIMKKIVYICLAHFQIKNLLSYLKELYIQKKDFSMTHIVYGELKPSTVLPTNDTKLELHYVPQLCDYWSTNKVKSFLCPTTTKPPFDFSKFSNHAWFVNIEFEDSSMQGRNLEVEVFEPNYIMDKRFPWIEYQPDVY